MLAALIQRATKDVSTLSDEHRGALDARLRALAGKSTRRLDAWSVEHAGLANGSFAWRPTTARRAIGNAALRRHVLAPSLTLRDCVNLEIDDLLMKSVTGYARGGSLAEWLAKSSPAVVALATSEAWSWANSVFELASSSGVPWEMAPTDAYYDVAQARTSLRGRRDFLATTGNRRVVVRVRAGSPGKSAGPGLRSDLVIDALSNSSGVVASRFIGAWPDAGVFLYVDGSFGDVRMGARDLVRTALAQERQQRELAA